jgi:hypothetical protein
MSAISDALASGGTYLKWEHPGTTYTGIITDVAMRQSRKYESTELDVWEDGTPKLQVVLTLATDYRDQAQQDDDGTRMISINLWSGQKKALVAACKAAGVGEPQTGQRFTATHVSRHREREGTEGVRVHAHGRADRCRSGPRCRAGRHARTSHGS